MIIKWKKDVGPAYGDIKELLCCPQVTDWLLLGICCSVRQVRALQCGDCVAVQCSCPNSQARSWVPVTQIPNGQSAG
ncbi:hypothetical protein MHYP_G00177490 [Metynnis hypsauchen]